MSEYTTIPKLCGSQNFTIWEIRMKALLVKQNFSSIINTDDVSTDVNDRALAEIHLFLQDGPLLQIRNETRAHAAWKALRSLYNPQGFSSEFLLLKEFFAAKLQNYNSMEEYLNKIRQLNDDLSAKNIVLPKQVIVAWVLNNLTDDFEMIVSTITQSLRTDITSYTFDQLFSNLLDESKRLSSLNTSHDNVLLTSTRGKQKQRYHSVPNNKYKIQKGKYCQRCKRNNHSTAECFFLKKNKQLHKQVQENKTSPIEEVDNLLITHENNTDQLIDFNSMDLDLDLGQDQTL